MSRGQVELRAVIYRYIKHRKNIDRLRAASTRSFLVTLNCFSNHVGPLQIDQVRRRHVIRFLHHKAREGVSEASQRQYVSRLRTFSGWCVREGYTTQDFMLGVPTPKKPRSIPRALTKDEVRAVLAVCPTSRERLIIALAVQTGLRVGEITRLRREDVDLDAEVLSVSGKGGHHRVLPIVNGLRVEIHRFLAEHPCSMGEPLIRSKNDGRSPLTTGRISVMVSQLMLEAGVKNQAHDGKSCHSFRHTMVVGMLENGAELDDAQKACGHRHLSTTADIYANRLRAMGQLRDAMEGREY